MHKKELVVAGKSLEEASKALIMVHGRGANAHSILGLAPHLCVSDYALIAPQATNNTWYPYSFLAAPTQNEPWLSSALSLLQSIITDLEEKKFSEENIFFLGFSQGACLALEFVTRNATRYGGVIAFTGGLIGDIIYTENYNGDFKRTPVFMGSSDPDMHVPVERVDDSAAILKKMGANVTKMIYKNMGHTISQDEINQANDLVFGKSRRHMED